MKKTYLLMMILMLCVCGCDIMKKQMPSPDLEAVVPTRGSIILSNMGEMSQIHRSSARLEMVGPKAAVNSQILVRIKKQGHDVVLEVYLQDADFVEKYQEGKFIDNFYDDNEGQEFVGDPALGSEPRGSARARGE
ncbi:hypothetical protein HQ571_05430 [Candidatus Kuenenbacteria bacterium]|nr:hypothetical protein [Candidatus Kuenenbacteria bacterium]